METDALLRLSRRLHAALGFDDVMAMVIDEVAAATRYRHAWMLVRTADGDGLEVVGNPSQANVAVHERVATLSVSRDPGLRRCFEATAPFVVDDLRLDPLADPEQVAFFGNRTVVGVPMVRLAERLGAFHVGTFGDEEGVMPPTKEELDLVVQIASLVSVVVGRLQAEEANRIIEEKMRANQRLEALGQLAGEVAHDFNNMLVSIVGNTDILVRMLVDPEALELALEVRDAGRRATRLTRQLLAFSRGQLLDRTDLSLAEVLSGLGMMLQHILPGDIELVVLAQEGPSVVCADRGQLEQIVVNLAINARDAMPNGGRLTVELHDVDLDASYVTAHPWAREGRYAVLSVTDTGSGMTPEVRARIFEPFFSTKPSTVGTGLGLAVVDSVLKQHEGFVHVYSEPGLGTTFKVYLPRSEGTVPAAPAPAVRTPTDGGRGQHILVVDDDPHIQTVVARILQAAGYRVTPANNGARALELLDAHHDVALVVTDLVMPVMSGQALVRELSTRVTRPAVLVMTGYARGAMADASFPFTLTKPFGEQQLLEKVEEALNAAQA